MSNIQTGAERMPHDLSHLGFLAGQIGRLITISTTPVIAGDSFEMDAVGALRLSPLRRGLAIPLRPRVGARANVVKVAVNVQWPFGSENIADDGDLIGTRCCSSHHCPNGKADNFTCRHFDS